MKISTNTNMCLRLDAVGKLFETQSGHINVLRMISEVFEQNKTYAITGTSGTGKSTLLQILAGLTPTTSGAVYVNEYNIALFDEEDRIFFLHHIMGLLFQLPYLIKELTVLENVMVKGLIAGKTRVDCKQEAKELLEVTGLIEKMDEKPPTLSGGQQQRVALARALFGQPAFLLADEPTGDLDPQTGQMIIDLMLDCQKKWGMGIIVSTHDAYVAQAMETIYVLADGLLQKKNMHLGI